MDAINVDRGLVTQAGVLPVIRTEMSETYEREKFILERPERPNERPIVRQLAPESQVLFGKDSRAYLLSNETVSSTTGVFLAPTVKVLDPEQRYWDQKKFLAIAENPESRVNKIVRENLFSEGHELIGTSLGFRRYEIGGALSPDNELLAWECRKAIVVRRPFEEHMKKQDTVEIFTLADDEKESITISPFENNSLHGEIDRHDVLGTTKDNHFVLSCVKDDKIVALSFVKPNENEEYGYETRVLKLSGSQNSIDVGQGEMGIVGRRGKILISHEQMKSLTQQQAGKAYRLENTGFVEV